MTALQPTHGSQADVFVNGNVVSQYFTEFTLGSTRDKAEVSAFKSVFKAYVAGMADATASFNGWFDPNIDVELYTYLTQITASGNMWMYAAQGAQGSGSFGNVAYSVAGSSTKYEMKSATNAANSVSAEVQVSASGGAIDRGNVYHGWATEAASGNTSSIDFGSASSAKGGVFVVHAFNDTAALALNLQDSADNSTFANVTGYAISPANTTTAAYRYPAAGTAPTGTVRRYTRITWTGTGSFFAMFARK